MSRRLASSLARRSPAPISTVTACSTTTRTTCSTTRSDTTGGDDGTRGSAPRGGGPRVVSGERLGFTTVRYDARKGGVMARQVFKCDRCSTTELGNFLADQPWTAQAAGKPAKGK